MVNYNLPYNPNETPASHFNSYRMINTKWSSRCSRLKIWRFENENDSGFLLHICIDMMRRVTWTFRVGFFFRFQTQPEDPMTEESTIETRLSFVLDYHCPDFSHWLNVSVPQLPQNSFTPNDWGILWFLSAVVCFECSIGFCFTRIMTTSKEYQTNVNRIRQGKRKREVHRHSASREWTYEYINTHGSHLYYTQFHPLVRLNKCNFFAVETYLHRPCIALRFFQFPSRRQSWSDVIHTMSNRRLINDLVLIVGFSLSPGAQAYTFNFFFLNRFSCYRMTSLSACKIH